AESSVQAPSILGWRRGNQRLAKTARALGPIVQEILQSEFLGGPSADLAALRGESLGHIAYQLDDLSRSELALTGTAAYAPRQDEHGSKLGSARTLPRP